MPGRIGAAIEEAVVDAARIAAPAAERAAFPAGLLLLLGLFLAFQNRLDGRDPKLAVAPVHKTPDLGFEPFRPGQEAAT